VIALILDLAQKKIISLQTKQSAIPFLPEKQVIIVKNGTATNNTILDLMLSRLAQQKHEHSVQQWATHWCGKTWSELLLPRHPSEELRRCILERLVSLDVLRAEKSVLVVGSSWESAKTAIKEALSQAVSTNVEPSETISEFHLRIILLCRICGKEILQSCSMQNTSDIQKKMEQQSSNLMTNELQTILDQGKTYLAGYKP